MEPDRWARLQDYFNAGINQDEAGRKRLFSDAGEQDLDLVSEVQNLWKCATQGFAFDDLPTASEIFSTPSLGSHACAYRILEPIASGGMGTVYRARQEPPMEREVALKILDKGQWNSEYLVRFKLEQRALASVSHPNIATVFDSGTTAEGLAFFTMEYLDGQTICQWCQKHQPSLQTRIALFKQVCEAVEHAHRRGIIHRDLKPANIMVVEQDRKPTVKVIDFGVARLADPTLGSDAFATLHGTLVGTPAYMSPEQAEGNMALIDNRTDIYSLGILLFQLLTGETPYGDQLQDISHSTLARFILDVPLVFPSEKLAKPLKNQIQGDLDQITLKALNKKSEDRYQSCAALLDDLNRYTQHRPISAGSSSMWQRIIKFINRHRALVGTTSSIILVLMVGMFSTYWQYTQTEQARQSAEDQAKKNLAFTSFVRHTFKAADPRRDGRTVTVFNVLMRAKEFNHSHQELEVQAFVYLMMADMFKNLGSFEEAETQLALVQPLQQHLSAEECLEYASITAYVHYAQGRTQKAEQAYRDAMVLAGNMQNGAQHLDALTSGLMMSLSKQQPEESLSSFAALLKQLEEARDEGDELTCVTRHNYANTLIAAGKWSLALAAHQTNLAIRQRKYGLANIRTLSSLHGIGNALQRQGKASEAEAYLCLAFEGRMVTLGEHHPKTVMSRATLAAAMGDQGCISEAIMLLQPLEQIGRPANGLEAWLMGLHNLGHFRMAAGDWEKAETTLLRVLDQRRNHFPQRPEDYLLTQWTLGENAWNWGYGNEARLIFVATLKEARLRLEEGSPVLRLLEGALHPYSLKTEGAPPITRAATPAQAARVAK